MFVTRRIAHLLLLGSFCLFSLTACGNNGDSATATGLQVTLIPAPEGSNGQTLTVQLTGADGQPITDATVSLEGNMNHAGMAPVLTDSVQDAADGAADGRYQVPFAFTMLGDWIITVSIQQADGARTQQNINLNISESGVTVQ